jgi:hypothetical protein
MTSPSGCSTLTLASVPQNLLTDLTLCTPMMAALPDAIVFKIMDQYKDGFHARMDAHAARMRYMFGELTDVRRARFRV